MKSYNIKIDMPTQLLAKQRLDMILKYEREPIIKIVHGYGSTGVGGVIKDMVRKELDERLAKVEIKAYIPGEAFGSLFGFDHIIRTYQHLLKHDPDYKRNNPGITYIIL
jgi:hypothetical protein